MRVRSLLSPFALVLVTSCVVLACGAGVALPGGSDGGTIEGGTTNDGGCVEPVEGAACNLGDTACSSGGNACCIGYVLVCMNGSGSGATWQRVGLGCACMAGDDAGVDASRRDAGPITCGTSVCTSTQYCTTGHGGVALPDGGSNTSFTCTPLPAACAANPTCACLTTNGGGGCSCSDTDGWPSVTCNYP